MAPAHVDGDAMTRAMGLSEENWTRATALGTGTAVVAISLRRLVESHHVAQACHEVMDQHALLRAQAIETAKGKMAFLVTSHSVSPNVEICPWPQISATSRAGDIAIAGADDGLAAAVNKVIRDEINTPFVNGEKTTSLPLKLFQVPHHLSRHGGSHCLQLWPWLTCCFVPLTIAGSSIRRDISFSDHHCVAVPQRWVGPAIRVRSCAAVLHRLECHC